MPMVMILTHLLEMYNICPSTCALTAETQPSEYYSGFFLCSVAVIIYLGNALMIRQPVRNILPVEGLILKMSLLLD